MSLNVGTLTMLITANTTGLVQAEKDIRRFGANAEAAAIGVSRTMARAFTIPIALIGYASMKVFSEFESSLAKIEGLVGISKEQTQAWGKELLALAPKVAQGPEKLAEALYYVTSSGYKSADALKITKIAAEAAMAGLGETVQIADIITSAMNAFGKSALSAERATDILIATVREGKGEPEQLVRAFGQVIPIAAQVGLSFEQVGGVLAALTRNGASAANASTYLRQALFTLLGGSKKTENELARLGTSTKELRNQIANQGLLQTLIDLKKAMGAMSDESMKKVFPNVRAFMLMSSLLGNNLEDTKVLMNEVANSTGSLGVAMSAVADTWKYNVNSALASGKGALIATGEAIKKVLLPIIKSAGAWLQSFAENFSKLSDAQQAFRVKLAILVAALGPLGIILTTLYSVILPGLGLALSGAWKAVLSLATAIRTLTTITGLSAIAFNAQYLAISAGQLIMAIFTGNVVKAKVALFNMQIALKALAGPIGWALIAIGAVGYGIYKWVQHARELSEVQKDLNSINEQANNVMAEEMGKITSLSKVAQNDYANKQMKHEAIKSLNDISPVYLGWITEETIATKKATEAIDAYNATVMQKAKVEAATEASKKLWVDYFKAVLDGTNEAVSGQQKLTLFFKNLTNPDAFSMRLRDKGLENADKLLQTTEQRAKQFAEIVSQTNIPLKDLIKQYDALANATNYVDEKDQERLKENIRLMKELRDLASSKYKSAGTEISFAEFNKLENIVNSLNKAIAAKEKLVKKTTVNPFGGDTPTEDVENQVKKLNDIEKALEDLKEKTVELARWSAFSGDVTEDTNEKYKLYTETLELLIRKGMSPLNPLVLALVGNISQLSEKIKAGEQGVQKYRESMESLMTPMKSITSGYLAPQSLMPAEYVEGSKALAEYYKEMNNADEAMKLFGDTTGGLELKLQAISKAKRETMKALFDTGNEEQRQIYIRDIEALGTEYIRTANKLEKAKAIGDTIGDVFTGLAGAIAASLSGVENSFASLLVIINEAMIKLGSTLIATGAAMLLSKKTAAEGAKQMAAGFGLVLLGSVGKIAAEKSIEKRSSKMAMGGIVPNGYPNDSYPAMLSSKEMVIPPNKLPDFKKDKQSMIVEVKGVIRGNDIHYIVEETKRRYKTSF